MNPTDIIFGRSHCTVFHHVEPESVPDGWGGGWAGLRSAVFIHLKRASGLLSHHVLCCSVMSDSLLPRDCNPPGSSVHGDSPGKTTGVDCHALPQWIFPIQGSNLGLPHCRQILYHLNHQEVPECPCFFKFPSKSVVLSIHHWSFIICIIPAVIKGPLDGFLDECVRTRKQ